MTMLELQIDSVGGNPAKHDHIGQHPVLHQNDSLQLKKGTGWGEGDGISKITFYENRTDYDDPRRTPVATWTPGGTVIPDKFRISQTPPAGSPVTAVTLTDAEPTGTDEDLWYVVTIGGKDLDPEVLNKGGEATQQSPTGWVNNA